MGPAGIGEDDWEGEVGLAVVRALAEAHDSLRQYVRRTLRNEADADDVMQELCVRVLLHATEVRREESIRPWLRRVLRSVLADYMRRRKARQRAEADFARKDAATPPPEEHSDLSVCMCLYKLLPILRPEYAALIRRIDLEGASRRTVAADLGYSLETLAVRLHRARHALRRALDASCETCPIHGFLDCGCDYMKRLRAKLGRAGATMEGTEL